MKTLRGKPAAKVLAWLLCLAGLAIGTVCAGQVMWLANQGAYQSQGGQMLLEQGEDELVRERLDLLYNNYHSYRVYGQNMDLSGDLSDSNFFFTIKNASGTILLSSDELGDYREKAVWQGEIQGRLTRESVTRYYDSPEEREAGLQELAAAYDNIYEVEMQDYGSLEESPKGRYALTAMCESYGVSEQVTISAFLRSDLTPGGPIYSQLTYLTEMGYARYTLAAFAVIGLVLGFLGLAFLSYSAGYGKGHPQQAVLHPIDHYLPADAMAVAALFLLFIWARRLDLGARTLSVLPLGAVLLGLVMAAMLVTGLLSFLRQKRAGTWKEGLLWHRLRHSAGSRLGKCKDALGRAIASVPLFWQAGVGFAVLCFFEGLCILGIRTGSGAAVLWLLLKAAEGLLLLWLVLSMRRLQEGAKLLAQGKLDYRVETEKLWGPFRPPGEDLNNLRQGIQHAVEEQMKSERMKTELITNVSHDIKTPLTSIVSYVDLLKKEEMPNDRAKEYLDVLDRQSARLKKLTEDLVEASKASTGSLTVDLQPTDVNVLLTQTAGEYQEKLAARDLALILTPAEGTPNISADGRLLWRVFENLFSNIHKYAQQGTRVYLTCQATAREVTITFRNISATPLNISADELMERFVRGDASRNTEGSGLGLSIARSLTQLQHGTFSLTIDGDLLKATLTFPRLS